MATATSMAMAMIAVVLVVRRTASVYPLPIPYVELYEVTTKAVSGADRRVVPAIYTNIQKLKWTLAALRPMKNTPMRCFNKLINQL